MPTGIYCLDSGARFVRAKTSSAAPDFGRWLQSRVRKNFGGLRIKGRTASNEQWFNALRHPRQQGSI